MYKCIYFQFHQFSSFLKRNVPGSVLGPVHHDGVIIISSLELLNISTFWLYFQIKSVTGTTTLDVILCSIVLLIINSIYFLSNKRYNHIIRTCKEKPSIYKAIGLFVTISYVFLTVFLFYLIHSGKITR